MSATRGSPYPAPVEGHSLGTEPHQAPHPHKVLLEWARAEAFSCHPVLQQCISGFRRPVRDFLRRGSLPMPVPHLLLRSFQ